MREALKTGKIWTLMSALLFIMTFGLVVYAASSLTINSPFSSWKSANIGNKLTADDWNVLMDKLDSQVPAGAIMAFVDRTSCPNGWTRYGNADGKFLMGSSNNIGSNGGSNSVTLSASNLPDHSHDILYGLTQQGYGDNASKRPVVVDYKNKKYPRSPQNNSSNADWKDADTKGVIVKTSSSIRDIDGISMSNSKYPVDVTNAHIKVLFCKKN